MLLVVLSLAGCATGGTTPHADSGTRTSATAPDGDAILHRACTMCHDLGGLRAYADYWGEPEWRSMVKTMIGYGARLAPEEVPVLVRFLAVQYGTGAGTSAHHG